MIRICLALAPNMLMLHSHIYEYGHVRNRHTMFITIEHKNLGHSKHVKTSRPGTKPLHQLWVKGLETRRRDTILYAVPFIRNPSRTAPTGHKLAPRLRAPKIDPSRLASNIQLPNFLQILTQISARFRCVTSPTPCQPVSPRTIVTSLSDMSALCALTRYHLH